MKAEQVEFCSAFLGDPMKNVKLIQDAQTFRVYDVSQKNVLAMIAEAGGWKLS